MDIAGLMHHYADYDLWANRRYIERLSTESDEVLDLTVASSFPSLRRTLLHIRDAEHIWLCRVRGAKHTWPAEASLEIDTLLLHCEQFRSHVKQLDGMALEKEIAYEDLRGNVLRQPAWQLLLHCFNHSTQHRGQLITMMRILDLKDIPANDLVAYQRTLTQ